MTKLCSLIILLTGCAGTETVYMTEYREVAVPQLCDAAVPKRPLKQEDIKSTIAELLRYTEGLETALDYCTGGIYVRD